MNRILVCGVAAVLTVGAVADLCGDAAPLVFTGATAQGVAIKAPSGDERSFDCWFKVEGCGQGNKPYDRIVQTPDWYLHLLVAPDEVGGAKFGYNCANGRVVGVDLDEVPLFGVWQHLTVIHLHDCYRVYINGVQAVRTIVDAVPTELQGGLACLGNSSIGARRPLCGQIWNARFWDHGLTMSEIERLVATDPDGRPVRRPVSAAPAPQDLLPVVDISDEASRQVVVAEGASDRYEGHPTTLLANDGRTLFCVWTTGHGGPCGQMARSDDGGKTWVRLDDQLPEVYSRTHKNCPVLQKIKGPDGKVRYFVYSAKVSEGWGLAILMSEDLGKTWVELPHQSHLSSGMPPTGLMELKDGTVALFGQIRKSATVKTDHPNDDQNIWMAISKDGGKTYGKMSCVMSAEKRNLCEPCCLRSPDGKSLVLIARENRHKGRSMMCFSDDEGASWSQPVDTPWALTGDRHEGILLPDGRYVIAFRDQAVDSTTRGQYMAWVGTFDDLRKGRNGQCRIHLLRHHGIIGKHPGSTWDTGYSGVELLADGTIVCTTYSRHFDDDRQSSVVSTRFRIEEIDARLGK